MREPVLKGPVHSILWIHNAILKESQEFEEAARGLDREDKTQITSLLDRFKFFHQVLKVHEDAEELAIFPVLERKFKYLAATYEFDHRRHLNSYTEIEDILAGLGRARSNSERVELARRLNRQAIASNIMMDLHIAKENELLFPTYDQLFSFEEQRAHFAQGFALTAHLPPDFTPRLMAWIFKAQTVDDREAFIKEFVGRLPPEHLAGMMKFISSAVSPQEWQEMLRRIPQLASISG